MAIPWLRLIDGVLGATDLVRFAKGRAASTEVASARGVENRLTGVVVSALKEAFNRDHERLEIERLRLEEERQRAERLMRLELVRQAGEREISRLRMLSGIATASLLASMFLITRLVGDGLGARIALGLGWLFLIASISAGFSAQSRVSTILADMHDRLTPTEITKASQGIVALWLLVLGLAVLALGVLLG